MIKEAGTPFSMDVTMKHVIDTISIHVALLAAHREANFHTTDT